MAVSTRCAVSLLVALASAVPAFAASSMLPTESVLDAAPPPSGEAFPLEPNAALKLLQREDVRRQLEELGVDPAEAERRLASLSPKETELLQRDLPQLKAGGDSTITIGVGTAIIIVILLIVFL